MKHVAGGYRFKLFHLYLSGEARLNEQIKLAAQSLMRAGRAQAKI